MRTKRSSRPVDVASTLAKWATVAAVLKAASVDGSKTPLVAAEIHSSWPAPSAVTLFAESVALESPTSLFPFLSYISSLPSATSPLSAHLLPNETHHFLTAALRELPLSSATHDAVQMTLALRLASAPIEAFRQLWLDRDAGFVGGDESQSCDNWIDVADRKACTVEHFWEVVGEEQREAQVPIRLPNEHYPPILYPFDHVSSVSPSLPLVIFYASPTDASFLPLFELLKSLAPRLRYALRWKPEKAHENGEGPRLVMSGYGAAMDIKKSDYLVIDDRQVAGDKAASQAESVKLVQLKKDEINELSLRAAAYILASETPLKAFSSLLSSFPLLAPTLSGYTPSEAFMDALYTNQMQPISQRAMFLVNGISIPVDTLEPLSLTRALRAERTRIESLRKASWGLMSPKDARDALMWSDSNPIQRQFISSDELGLMFDWREEPNEEGILLWWNDLEKDKRYASWPTSVRDLLRRTYPGQLNLVGRNFHSLIVVADLAHPASLSLIAGQIRQFIAKGIPIRFGLVPITDGESSEESEAVARIMWYLIDRAGRKRGMELLSELAAHTAAAGERVTIAALEEAYGRVSEAHLSTPPLPDHPAPASLLPYEKAVSKVDLRVRRARHYCSRLGVEKASGPGGFFLNGVYFTIDDEFAQNVQRTLAVHGQYLQQQVYVEKLLDTMDVSTFFPTGKDTYIRRNRHVFPTVEDPLRVVNLVDTVWGRELIYLDAVMSESEGEEVPAYATIYVVADLDTRAGRATARDALQVLDKRTDVRVSIIHNPRYIDSPVHGFEFSPLIHRLYNTGVLWEILPSELVHWLDLELTDAGLKEAELDRAVWADDDPLRSYVTVPASAEEIATAHAYWDSLIDIPLTLGFKAGQNGLVINGRVVGPFQENEFEGYEMVELALDFELTKRIKPALKAFNSTAINITTLTIPEQSLFYAMATSVLSEAILADPAAGMFGPPVTPRTSEYRDLDVNSSAILSGNPDIAVFEIAIIVDPVSEVAQKLAPIVETLATLGSVHLRLYINPRTFVPDLPIKRFYEYSFQAKLEFDIESGEEIEPSVAFEGLPEDTLFTFGMDAQRSWLAFPKTSVQDLDNIRLADLSAAARAEGVNAIFELESIVIEGHARELPSGQPPHGLQLELQSNTAPTVDTICMSNLGYFQLKANPGAWRFAIREGRGTEVYELESAGASGWRSGSVDEVGDFLTVTTLEGLTVYPRFRRRPGHELTQLLDVTTLAKSSKSSTGVLQHVQKYFSFLSPWLGSSASTSQEIVASTASTKADINIFTVASGLLYERMAFIMMVSVLRHTESTVKFWFISNFLSPSFKAFIPHMAQEYGFQYEYKILFLDVLFPMDLDRVIFVDSDQIVRADLKELVDLDLKGAPYGYAPMGSDREETAGFRFWDSGYWKEHLQGRPYHISALYVVDLDRFRAMAAGDRLRQQYQQLSADPNSLSNLDQDLPNNMQREIPIFTLDRNWLWCATWCSDESLATAKTIDLCNNPLTHEPKLARAKRMLPEWTVYDEEVAAFARRVAAGSSAIGAFGQKADELVQAVEQKAERDEFVEKEGGAAAAGGKEDRVKDEL